MADELIGREALERIIGRAAELQASERDIGEGLTREDVVALGKDVGIPGRYLKQALVEEQARGSGLEAGWLAWLGGPAVLRTARVVPGDRAAVERALAAWLEGEELLQVKRRFSDHTTWEPKAGAFASLQRALGAGGKRFALARATEVAGGVTALDAGVCHVQLVADVRSLRRQRLAVATGLLGAGALLAAAAPALGAVPPWPAVPFAVGALAAFGARRGQLAEDERIQVSLEQVLDHLERGEPGPPTRLPPPVSALGRIAEELRKTLGAPP